MSPDWSPLIDLCAVQAATPIWEELSKWIETHEDAKKQLGRCIHLVGGHVSHTQYIP